MSTHTADDTSGLVAEYTWKRLSGLASPSASRSTGSPWTNTASEQAGTRPRSTSRWAARRRSLVSSGGGTTGSVRSRGRGADASSGEDHMKRLAGTDALFLAMETPSWHQHVGGLTILDPEGRDVTFKQFLDNVERRIPLAPKFRWKLKEVPLRLDRPVWVDDPDFDVRKHVRRIGVPSPGGPRETAEVAGQLLG